ncbi:Calcineurin subunit B [Podochytrium sp. JEL0797]|nr:Calcineurin subunit B [Podochytrium sp. JEL0797]
MGASVSSDDVSLTPDQVLELHHETGLPTEAIARLYARFRQLDKTKVGTLTSSELLSIPEFSMNPLALRIIAVLDPDRSNEISFAQFICGLSLFAKGTAREQKLTFAFRVYDVDCDGFISFEDLQTILKLMVGKTLQQKEIEDLVRQTIWEADTIDKDGAISFEEFKRSMFGADLDASFSIDF